MRILLVNEGNVERAGVCLFMYQWLHILTRYFADNEITVYFRAGIKDEPLKKAFEDDGIRIIAGGHPIEGTSADQANRNAIKSDLKKILKEEVDIVHINSAVIGFTSIVLNEAKKANVPIRICHAHGKFDESKAGKLIHDMLRIFIRREATLYAGCSKSAGEYMFGKKGIKSGKWRFVPNAIDTGYFRFDGEKRAIRRQEIGIGSKDLLLGAVGYLEEVKNHSFLIDVVGSLKKRNIQTKLVIIGTGSLINELSQKIHAMELEHNIILYGKADNVAEWLSAMDIFLMPSLSEGLPLSAVEAQASGLPCLLSDHISDEVDISPYISHLPIDQGVDVWVEKIKEIYNSEKNTENRFFAANMVYTAGFDWSALKAEIIRLYGLSFSETKKS